MIDLFVRVFSSNELRLGFAIATVARWRMQRDVRVHIFHWSAGLEHDWWAGHREGEFVGHSINTPEHPFATWSLQEAETIAQSDPYIICNDDNLPLGQDFVQKGLALMERHPEFGVVSGRVTNGEPYPDDWSEIHEIHAVGGLVFLRKNLVTEFPALEDCHWDFERHRQITGKGFKSGTAKSLPYLHMGAGFSIASPAHWWAA